MKAANRRDFNRRRARRYSPGVASSLQRAEESHLADPIIEGRYLLDILAQPQAIAATVAGLRGDRDLNARVAEAREQKQVRLVLTGMGSSFHALYPLEIALVAHGETVCRAETSELIHSLPALLAPESIIIAVSQSGQSAETVRMLEQNQHRARVIAVTNTPGSRLAREADLTILTRAGDEFSVSCKTYVASLCALETLGGAWCGHDAQETFSALLAAADRLDEYLGGWRDHVETLASELEGVRQIFYLGRGVSLASAETGALITKESTRSFSEGMSSAAFRHGPLELLGPETMVFVFEGEGAAGELNRKFVADLRARHGRVELIGPGARIPALRLPSVSPRVLPILEIAPAQMLTLTIAARAGREAGRFAHATKITAEE
jgi:glutamine---fructose-6-phosphate transaminase (isomerizing)